MQSISQKIELHKLLRGKNVDAVKKGFLESQKLGFSSSAVDYFIHNHQCPQPENILSFMVENGDKDALLALMKIHRNYSIMRPFMGKVISKLIEIGHNKEVCEYAKGEREFFQGAILDLIVKDLRKFKDFALFLIGYTSQSTKKKIFAMYKETEFLEDFFDVLSEDKGIVTRIFLAEQTEKEEKLKKLLDDSAGEINLIAVKKLLAIGFKKDDDIFSSLIERKTTELKKVKGDGFHLFISGIKILEILDCEENIFDAISKNNSKSFLALFAGHTENLKILERFLVDSDIKVVNSAFDRLIEKTSKTEAGKMAIRHVRTELLPQMITDIRDASILVLFACDDFFAKKVVDRLSEIAIKDEEYPIIAKSESALIREWVAKKTASREVLLSLLKDDCPMVVRLAFQNLKKIGIRVEDHVDMVHSPDLLVLEWLIENTNDPEILSFLAGKSNDIAKMAGKKYLLLNKKDELSGAMEIELVNREGFFSMWATTNLSTEIASWKTISPVYCFMEDGGNFEYIKTTSKSSPYKINVIKLGSAEGLKKGDYCDRHCIPVPQRLVKYVNDIFEQVRNGITILPEDIESKKIVDFIAEHEEKERKKREKIGIVYRTWGQNFLSKLKPDSVRKGELLGSGGSCKAFYFKKKDGQQIVVVESDLENKATFLFAEEFFDKIRTKSRSEIREESPEGFFGIIEHRISPENWEEKIREFLKF